MAMVALVVSILSLIGWDAFQSGRWNFALGAAVVFVGDAVDGG
jgi:hypothetical protein